VRYLHKSGSFETDLSIFFRFYVFFFS